MRKALTAVMAAITFGGAVAATAAPAQAEHYRGRDYRRHHDDNDAGVAIAAGVVGLALGAAIAGSNDRPRAYDYSEGYGPRYARPYGYAPRYRVCETQRWVWDDYYGRQVLVRERFPC